MVSCGVHQVAARGNNRVANGRLSSQGLPRLAAAIGNRRFAQLVQAQRQPALARSAIALGPVDDALEAEARLAAAGRVRPRPVGAAPARAQATLAAPPSVARALSTPGRALDSATRSRFETRYGADLGQVRVHDDHRAAASAADVDARAYTVGTDIVLGSGERADDPEVLGHELAHAVQDSEGQVLRRLPTPSGSCTRLLGDARRRRGPRIAESSAQEWLADEIGIPGEIEREFAVPAGSAAPYRTDGGPGDDTYIDPQVIDRAGRGLVDIAFYDGSRNMEFLEVKEATFQSLDFAERQLANYIVQANSFLQATQSAWIRRGHQFALFQEVDPMPQTRWTPPTEPTQIEGQDVLFGWCGDGVIVFKTLDRSNRDLLYCGISDEGETDAFIDRILGQAEEYVANALRRRLLALGEPEVNLRLLLDEVRNRLKASIRWLLERAIKAVCAAAIELSAAAVLEQLRRWLRNQDLQLLEPDPKMAIENLADGLLYKLTPDGEKSKLPLGEAAARTAGVLSIGVLLDALLDLGLIFA